MCDIKFYTRIHINLYFTKLFFLTIFSNNIFNKRYRIRALIVVIIYYYYYMWVHVNGVLCGRGAGGPWTNGTPRDTTITHICVQYLYRVSHRHLTNSKLLFNIFKIFFFFLSAIFFFVLTIYIIIA